MQKNEMFWLHFGCSVFSKVGLSTIHQVVIQSMASKPNKYALWKVIAIDPNLFRNG